MELNAVILVSVSSHVNLGRFDFRTLTGLDVLFQQKLAVVGERQVTREEKT